jgi:hypothetical protein
MTTICAWCKTLMAGPPPAEGERVSHGCCAPCARKLDEGDVRGAVGEEAYRDGSEALLRDVRAAKEEDLVRRGAMTPSEIRRKERLHPLDRVERSWFAKVNYVALTIAGLLCFTALVGVVAAFAIGYAVRWIGGGR